MNAPSSPPERPDHRTETKPPGWAVRLLERVLPSGTAGASVRADLDQEFAELLETTSPARARRWYSIETVKLAWHFAWGGGEGRVDRGGFDRLRQNVRISARQFVRAPGFVVTAVATIAIGIGATVSIFSVVDAVLLEPLPYDNPDELVAIWEWNMPRDRQNNVANPGNFSAWRDGGEAFAAMSAVAMAPPATVTVAGEPAEAIVQATSEDFFSVLGLEAELGRTFIPDPSAAEAAEVVLSHRYWRERFGAAEEAIGQTIEVNGVSAVVVGVLPDQFVLYGEGTDVWASRVLDRGDQTNTGRFLMVVGRLAPGSSFEIAEQELKAISRGLEEDFPDFNAGWSVNLVPLEEEVVGDLRSILWMLFAAVGLLQLIACANVGNLFLVRATARRQEMAVRSSLGASRGTLLGQLLTESMVIAGAGALVGVLAAQFATRWMATSMPAAFALPRIEGVQVDSGVLLFAAAITVGTALLFGVLPSLQAGGSGPAQVMRAEGRGASRRTGVVRDLLVIGEVGLSIVLLSGAALFLRSFATLASVEDGIEAEQVLVGRVNLAGPAYPGTASKLAFFEELIANVEQAPQVDEVGGITFLPMDGLGAATSYWVTDRQVPDPEDRRAADIRNVSGDYFGAMGIDLLQGRLFDLRDRADAPQTIVVNRSFADRYWPGGAPIGRGVVVNWTDDEPWEIIGVVEDVRAGGPSEPVRETIYIHNARAMFFPWLHLTVRGSGDPETLREVVRTELRSLDETLPLGNVRIMQDIVDGSVARARMTSGLMIVFAGLATLLAAVGLYGVLAYTVSQRVREIGVRVALGARPERVVRMVVAQGVRLVALGLVAGLTVSVLGGRLIAGLLYEVAPSDPVALAAASMVLGLVAIGACAVPAWRATRITPAEALAPD